MFETFEKLPESRREQILQVCMEEFVRHGYINASTNRIVNRLGISKGVLFLYFKNKKSLYLYLVEHVSKLLIDDYFDHFGGGPVMVINVFDHLGEYYKKLLQEKPELILFMLEAFVRAPAEMKEEVEARHSQVHGKAISYLDKAGFREGIDIETVVDLLHIVSYHVGQMIFDKYKDKDICEINREEINRNIDYFEEVFSKYIDILKYGVYEKRPVNHKK